MTTILLPDTLTAANSKDLLRNCTKQLRSGALCLDGEGKPRPGVLFYNANCQPIIEVADDGKTARGLWYCISQETVPTSETEADARWYMEKLAIDFLKEDGVWKIWHVVVATDLQSEAGANYMEQKVYLPDEENPAYVEFGTPTIPMLTHNVMFNWLDNYPAPPAPYATFDEDNSYGPEGHPDQLRSWR